jgi:transposase-like protein
MTNKAMNFQAPSEEDHRPNFLREMIGFTVQRLVALEVEPLVGMELGARTLDRLSQRNRYRDRDWKTRVGTVEFRNPKLPKESYFSGLLELRRMPETALTAVMQEAFIQGVSTCSLDDLIQAMGVSGIFKSRVSRLYG